MLRRLGFYNQSEVDKILEQPFERIHLEHLLLEEDLLQECKSHNPRLINYLSQPHVITQLLEYSVGIEPKPQASPDTVDSEFAFVASEIFACEVWDIVDTVCNDLPTLFSPFWSFIEAPAPLNPLYAEHFSKVVGVLLQHRTTDVVSFIRSRPNLVQDHLLHHINTSAAMDLLLKIISLEELPEGAGIVEWLNDQGLMDALLSGLDPTKDPEDHAAAAQVILDIITISQCSNPELPSIGTNALITELKSARLVGKLVDYMLDPNAPHATSSLVNGVAIFIELIRRNYVEMDEDMLTSGMGMEGNGLSGFPQQVDLTDLITVLSHRLSDFQHLLLHPRLHPEPVDTTVGKQVPLGFERLRVCELFAELLHLSSMALLNISPATTFEEEEKKEHEKDQKEKLGQEEGSSNGLTPGDTLKSQFIHAAILPTCLDLFFNFPWNNFLHTVVYDMVHQVLNIPLETSCNLRLVQSLFRDGRLSHRITQAQRQCDYEAEQPRGVRLGYMGHLTFIADQVVRLFERSREDLDLEEYTDDPEWRAYVEGTLRETREKDRITLGGDSASKSLTGSTLQGGNGAGILGDSVAAEQFRRYLSHQMASSLPDDFASDDDEEDEVVVVEGGGVNLAGNSSKSWMDGFDDEDDDDDEEDEDKDEDEEEE
ncbi:MAG: SIT4 phosphatase-associated protein-domain-containing protein, partial [Piptocephalis tieghemiana]